MFTGIIQGIGCIESLARFPSGLRLTISAPDMDLSDIHPGDSIAHNGACMTVIAKEEKGCYQIDVSNESLRCTVGLDQVGKRLNLEKALRLGASLDGHLLTGHVDGMGHIVQSESMGEYRRLVIYATTDIAKYLALKGSIAVNGVSLTINQILDVENACGFSVHLIPYTLKSTTFGEISVGDTVNLEIDLIARYVERMTHFTDPSTTHARRSRFLKQ